MAYPTKDDISPEGWTDIEGLGGIEGWGGLINDGGSSF